MVPSDRTRSQTIAIDDKPEIRRNGGSPTYRANRAERSAWERALRPKPCRLALNGSYDGAWRRSLRCNGRQSNLRLAEAAVPDERDMRIFHEAIYRSLLLDRGVLKRS